MKLIPVYIDTTTVSDDFEQRSLAYYRVENDVTYPPYPEIDEVSTRIIIIWKVYATQVYKQSPDEAEVVHIEAPREQAAAFIYQRAYLNPNEVYPFAIVTEAPPGYVYFPDLSEQAARMLCPYIDFYASRWINEGAVDYELHNP